MSPPVNDRQPTNDRTAGPVANIVKRDHSDALSPRPSLQVDASLEQDELLALRRISRRMLRKKHYVAAVFFLVVVPAAIATYVATPL
jgi:hypothetical protein